MLRSVIARFVRFCTDHYAAVAIYQVSILAGGRFAAAKHCFDISHSAFGKDSIMAVDRFAICPFVLISQL
ncbi:unknown [Tropheryma whipplei str. Twist]|uniref:Uncharacterized protein n=1 Tax=Tropheryma whipplei (strain Twist) TaxID=203267 RepID=Q83FI5_TROWT|nr:unknown [Tropheryma whipplei str. Twist]